MYLSPSSHFQYRSIGWHEKYVYIHTTETRQAITRVIASRDWSPSDRPDKQLYSACTPRRAPAAVYTLQLYLYITIIYTYQERIHNCVEFYGKKSHKHNPQEHQDDTHSKSKKK